MSTLFVKEVVDLVFLVVTGSGPQLLWSSNRELRT